MKAVVRQPFGKVVDSDASAGLDGAQINDALVGDHAIATGIEHRVVIFKARRDIVGGEDRDHGRAAQATGAHHRDIGPGDTQDAGRAPRCGRYRADRTGGASIGIHAADHRVIGQIRREMRLDADRAHARPATTMGYGKGLVQIDVHDIGANLRWPTDADQGVEVGAIHVHLATMFMHDVAQLDDRSLEHAMGRGIGDHETGELWRVLRGLATQIGDVDIAALIALHHDHAQSRHRRAGRVGAVGRSRDQTHVARAFAAHFVIFTDHQQARVFALRAGVRLQ